VTSARAVSRVKRLLPKRTKIGHTGTLDPLASGLLVLLLGRATRLSRYVTDLEKTYTATARLGAVSDTLDADGEISALDAPMPDERMLRATLPNFTGDLLQIPPMASAVKVGGVRLYDLHRRGLTVEREPRLVTIHSLTLIAFNPDQQSATFEVSCSSGTYVRTLISDLAASLDTGAYLTALRRTSVGNLSVEDASPPNALSPANLFNRIIQPREVVSHLPALEVGAEGERAVGSGRVLRVSGVRGSFRVERGGELLAVYRGEGEVARAEVVLCGG
jgi:tRNA pseudouridine55 synthase